MICRNPDPTHVELPHGADRVTHHESPRLPSIAGAAQARPEMTRSRPNGRLEPGRNSMICYGAYDRDMIATAEAMKLQVRASIPKQFPPFSPNWRRS